MAKSKVKTHKTASVQRKAIQSAQNKKWDRHWFGRNSTRYGFSGVCSLSVDKEPVFLWSVLSEQEKQAMLKQALINLTHSVGYENGDVIPDADFNGFTYKFRYETTYRDWRNPAQGRNFEWRSKHFTIEKAVSSGFKTDKWNQGFYDGNVKF